MFDVITIGSATIDAFAESAKNYIKKGCYSYPIGSKSALKDLHFNIGGGGTNTAVSFSRLGLKTAWLGELGSDHNAHQVLDLLKDEKVDTSMVCQCGEKTGYSIILDAQGEDRTILAFKGSNNLLDYKKVNKTKLNQTKWIYSSAMLGKSLKSLKEIFAFAEKKKIPTAFNPSSYLVKKGKTAISSILKKSSVLIYNKEEAQTLTGKKDIDKLLHSSKRLIKKDSIVVITDGVNGSYAYNGKFKYFIGTNKIRINETTGAGDAFASAFVAMLAKGKDISFAMVAGTLNAESVIQHIGAKNKLLTWDELITNMRKNKMRVKVDELG